MGSTSIYEELRFRFRSGNMVTKLIFVNLIVFVSFKLIILALFFAQSKGLYPQIAAKFAIPAHLPSLAVQPWSVITYMFFHESFMHILFNMLWLFWFGEIFVLYLGDKKILPLYLLGGFAGALVYVLAFNLLPVFSSNVQLSSMLGASASVLAIVFAAVTINPDHEVRLLFFGDVKIKYIAFASLLIDIISIPNGNAGGYIAHLGGAVCGWLFIKGLRSGVDAGKPMTDFTEMITAQLSKQRKVTTLQNTKGKVIYETTHQPSRTIDEQERVDAILDKISRSGYDSLTKEEKQFLFQYSSKS